MKSMPATNSKSSIIGIWLLRIKNLTVDIASKIGTGKTVFNI